MDVFVARQPILDKQKNLFGYELLFRTGMKNVFPDIDGDTATSSLLASSFFSIGIEKISGGSKSFVNFSEGLLLKGTPSLFPQERIIVEILEDIRPTEDVINACKELKRSGYTLALDDFSFTEDHKPLLALADIVKVDFIQTSQEEMGELLRQLKQFPCKLLAEKIETHEEFQKAKEMDFSYFQGYFFSKPEVLKNRDIPQNKLTMLQLISQINKAEFDVGALEALINKDVAVSYKLMKYLNSACFGRISPLKSIRQAIAYLGERGIRLFVSLIATSQLADKKPDELVRISIIRGRFLEQLAAKVKRDNGEMFMLGLFSLIDAMLDNPMDYLVQQLPLSENVCQALVHREGPLTKYLRFVESFERGDWTTFQGLKNGIGIDEKTITEFYLDAVGWADSLTD